MLYLIIWVEKRKKKNEKKKFKTVVLNMVFFAIFEMNSGNS